MEHRNIVLAQTETPLKHKGKEEAEEPKEKPRNAGNLIPEVGRTRVSKILAF
jgi:hypothetical protein